MLNVLQAVVFMRVIGAGLIPNLDDRMDAPSLSTFLQEVARIDAEVAPDLRQLVLTGARNQEAHNVRTRPKAGVAQRIQV